MICSLSSAAGWEVRIQDIYLGSVALNYEVPPVGFKVTKVDFNLDLNLG